MPWRPRPDPDAPPRRPRERIGRRIAVLALLSLGVHLVLTPMLTRGLFVGTPGEAPLHVTVLSDDDPALRPPTDTPPPPPEAPPDTPMEAAPPQRARQIVDMAAPAEQVRPKDADYLSEYDRTVPEETRTETTQVNPEVVADRVSAETQAAKAETPPAGTADKPDPTGGSDLDPSRSGHGPILSRVPARFRMDQAAGLAATSAQAGDAQPALGAPQNDLLDERIGDEVALNSLSYPGARYFNGIRGKVNFYWSQNVDNLPRNQRLLHPEVKTRVRVVLDGAGTVADVAMLRSSGDARVDRCVLSAFRDAGPFPDPPKDLVSPDGNVHLPDFIFTIQEILGAR